MKNNSSCIKKFFVIFAICMLSTFLFQEGAFSFFSKFVSAQEKPQSAYETAVDDLASSVGFSQSYQSFYENGQTVTLYNFVSLIKFQNEAETINTVHPTLNKTYVQILNEMYNSQTNYSVNKYYKTVSNNMLNLITVFVHDTSSLTISKPRSTYGEKNLNGGVGYDENAKIASVLPVQYALEYEMLDQIYYNAISSKINTASYRELSDYNQDGLIDSLSIMLLPDPNKGTASEVKIGWSDLLWPHASQVQMSLINSYGSLAGLFGYSISASHFKYTYNSKTYSAGNYMLSDINFDFVSSVTDLPKNVTFVHELGHVIGWPDYYIYNDAMYGETTPNSTEPVAIWEVMAGTNFDLPQYPTTYSRNLQGWFNNTGVTEITENGQYTLKQVNYEEVFGVSYSGRTVAYKITNPNNPYQSIWFEYRKQSSSSFERNSTQLKDGLLVYRVDEGFGGLEIDGFGMGMMKSAGNFAAAPYNLYVFRNDVAGQSIMGEVQRATLNMGNQSMGDGQTYVSGGQTYTATDITWQVYDGDINTPQNEIPASAVTFENSGMVVKVISMNESTGEITFEVNYNELNGDIVTADDFEDENLYYKLLELAGKLASDDLYVNDLETLTNLDLQSLNLNSIAGLELMVFENLQTLNLNNNLLNNITSVQAVINNNPNVIISLIKNKFNLSSLSQGDLQSSRIIWGMQLNLYDESHYVFNNLTHTVTFFWQTFYNNYFTMNLNSQSVTTSSSLQYHTFNSYGQFEFAFEPVLLSGFTGEAQSIFTTIIQISLPNLNVEKNDSFPNLIVNGISADQLNISRNPSNINTSVLTQNLLVTWSISVKAKPSATYSIYGYFNIVDTQKPVVTLASEEPIQMIFGENLVLPNTEITITDNQVAVSYTFLQSPLSADTLYWSRKYYKLESGVYSLISGDFASQPMGEYAIGYYAVDESKNQSDMVYRRVIITGEEIEQGKFASANLYQAILNLTGKTKVYENSLAAYSYIDFSNMGISSLNGLELLEYGADTVIDLSNNNISSIRRISGLIENENVSFINLAFNNLVPNAEVIENNEKYLLGIQGITNDTYIYEMSDHIQGSIRYVQFYNFNDHQDYYTLLNDVEIGYNTITNYGVYTYVFSSISNLNSTQKTFKYGNVYAPNSSLTYDVFDTVTIFDLYEMEEISEEDVTLEYLVGGTSFDPNTTTFGNATGLFNITINVLLNNTPVKSLPISLEFKDRILPTLTLNGKQNMFLLVGQEYQEDGYLAHDNYDQNLFVQIIGEVDYETPGVYQITYKAIDESFNESDLQTRTVIVGNITPKKNMKVDVKTRTSELDMFDFITFSKNDFQMSLIGDSYNEQVIGTYPISVLLTHKQDSSFSLELQNTVTVLDRISPTIELLGLPTVTMFVGSIYTESGARVWDNYDDLKQVTNISNTLNVNLVGTYTITYHAQDQQGNLAESATRLVNVIPRQFNALNTILVSSAENLYLDNMIRFKADISSYDPNLYDFNSTFIWFVDGVEVQRAKDIYLQTSFSEVGTHNVEVKVLNLNLNGQYDVIDGNAFQVQISEGGFLEKFGIPIIISVSVLIVLSVIYSLFLRKKRKFYF